MNTIINKFEVALGEEDGHQFAAILWPAEMGKSPFSDSARLVFTEQGFAVYPTGSDQSIEFKGVDKNAIAEMAVRNVVILEQNGADYAQYAVSKINNPT
jgi:hypothetical protein